LSTEYMYAVPVVVSGKLPPRKIAPRKLPPRKITPETSG